jgi:hypothetical protein
MQVSPCEHVRLYMEHMSMIVSTRMLYHYLSTMPTSHWFHELSYPCNVRTSISLCLQYSFLLFTIATITAVILLLLLLFHYYYHYKTIATDKLLRARLFPGAAELTTYLLRLTYILWLPLCRINKFGFYFPRRLLRSPILVGHRQLMIPFCDLQKQECCCTDVGQGSSLSL